MKIEIALVKAWENVGHPVQMLVEMVGYDAVARLIFPEWKPMPDEIHMDSPLACTISLVDLIKLGRVAEAEIESRHRQELTVRK